MFPDIFQKSHSLQEQPCQSSTLLLNVDKLKAELEELTKQKNELTSTYKNCEKEVRDLKRKQENLNQYLGRTTPPDVAQEQLEKRILALSPAKAYYQGEQIWQKQRRIQNILMDDAELVQEFQKDFDQKDLEDLLAFKYYQAVQFGRHYKAEGMDEEEDETGLEEVDEDMDELDFLQSQREPEMLVPDGDLRDQEYEYACELLEEYTGRRIFPVEGDGDMAYWSIYEDEFSDLIDTKLLQSLDTTLARLAEDAPEKLKNLADPYEIGQDDLKNGAEYAVRTNEFAYYYSGLFDSILFNFGEEKAAEVFRRGRELAQKASGA